MSYPWCRICRRDILPGVGCACRDLHEAAAEHERRERQAEHDYDEAMAASLAAERHQYDQDTAADLDYEARRARAGENAQARDDLRRGDR